MIFKRATLDDARVLFDWRNDPLTRAQSHDSSELSFDAHMTWYQNSMNMNTREIYFAVISDHSIEKKVGTIRRDQTKNGYLLSWSVNPETRGKGYGSKMLYEFVRQFQAVYFAEIKNTNIASIKMTEKAGFKLFEQKDDFQIFKFES